MRRFYLLACFFLLFAFTSCFSAYAKDISARGAVLIEAQSRNIAFEKNMNERMPMASTTKIMTALVALENAHLDDTVQITQEMTGVEGSSIYLRPGEELTVSELLYALMLESANDSATALAIHIGGSIDEFVTMMNEKAKSLGLTNTSFANPHGLDNENHYTTPYELGIIAIEAMKNKEFCKIVSSKKAVICSNKEENTRVLINHNKLLRSYDGVIGVKTGFTKRCGRCLVSYAERDGVALVAVTLNAPNDWNDHKTLLDLGFSQYESIRLASSGDYCIRLNTINGEKSEFLAGNLDTLDITVQKGSAEIYAKLEANRLIPAPICKGQRVGNIVFYNSEEKIAVLPLYAKESVDSTRYKKSIWERLFK